MARSLPDARAPCAPVSPVRSLSASSSSAAPCQDFLERTLSLQVKELALYRIELLDARAREAEGPASAGRRCGGAVIRPKVHDDDVALRPRSDRPTRAWSHSIRKPSAQRFHAVDKGLANRAAEPLCRRRDAEALAPGRRFVLLPEPSHPKEPVELPPLHVSREWQSELLHREATVPTSAARRKELDHLRDDEPLPDQIVGRPD